MLIPRRARRNGSARTFGRCGPNSLPVLPFVSRLEIRRVTDFGISGSGNPKYETGKPRMFHTRGVPLSRVLTVPKDGK